MKFIWKMTEENWKNMMQAIELEDFNGDFYGAIYVGDYCIEFMVIGNDSWTDIYRLFIDNNYAYEMTGNRYTTIDGIPYDLIGAQIDIPKANSFEKFKKLCEKEFISKIGVCFWKEFADKKCEWLI